MALVALGRQVSIELAGTREAQDFEHTWRDGKGEQSANSLAATRVGTTDLIRLETVEQSVL
jgi:hypothetical protein